MQRLAVGIMTHSFAPLLIPYKTMKNNIIKSTELKVYEKQTNLVIDKANQLVIKTDSDMIVAVDGLKQVKSIAANIKELKEKYTKPANEILKVARSMFGPFENNLKDAEAIIKAKMLQFDELKIKESLKEAEKIAKAVKSGKLDISEAGEKLANIEPSNSYSGENGSISYKKIKKVVITDVNLIPRKYLVPNEMMIKNDLLLGISIKGCQIVEEKIVASR
jgi:hypothetical protein